MTRFDDRAFWALWRDAGEVHQLRARATSLLATRGSTTFDGIGDVLRQIIPDDQVAVAQVARVLNFTVEQLEGLRWGDMDPTAVPSERLATLGHVLGLDLDSFIFLVARDHSRFADAGSDRGATSGQMGGLADLRNAWSREFLDHPDDI